MIAGGANLGLVSGKLQSRFWRLTMPLALLVSGAAFLVHEQNGWLYARSAFVHHLCGWTLVAGGALSFFAAFRTRPGLLYGGYALTILVCVVALYASRDVAPVFGHLSPEAGAPHR